MKMFCNKLSLVASRHVFQKRRCHSLQLTNTFKKSKEPVIIAGHEVTVGSHASPLNRVATVYCCGPTVYDDCHLGHGFNYIRFDLFRRILSVYCHIPLMVAMNITDIDDKIIHRAKREGVDSRILANTYFEAFQRDLKSLNITPPHVYLRVTDHIQEIIEYVQHLEREGKAYVNEETLDVVFDYSSTPVYSETHETEQHTDESKAVGKKSPRDFVLWKKSKPGEPSFDYESPSKQTIVSGRPGWHVECAALVNSFFGPSIDFHFGGKDLIFPHHYSEAACCHVFNNDSSSSVTSFASHWIHSGHLIHREDKMSKSLGNMITIQEFLEKHHFNIVRLMCIRFHYRSDLRFCREMINLALEVDKQLKHLIFFVVTGIRKRGKPSGGISVFPANQIESQIEVTRKSIVSGIADDLDLNRGLEEIVNLYRLLRSHQQESVSAVVFLKVLFLLQTWMTSMGLDYDLPPVLETVALATPLESLDRSTRHLEMLMEVRRKVRALGIHLVKQNHKKEAAELLLISDSVRNFLDEEGIKVFDKPVAESSSSSPSSRSSRN